MPLANTVAALSLLDRFRVIGWHLALRLNDIRWTNTVFDRVAEGCNGRGRIQLLVHSAEVIGWTGNVGLQAWSGPGLPELHIFCWLQTAILGP